MILREFVLTGDPIANAFFRRLVYCHCCCGGFDFFLNLFAEFFNGLFSHFLSRCFLRFFLCSHFFGSFFLRCFLFRFFGSFLSGHLHNL